MHAISTFFAFFLLSLATYAASDSTRQMTKKPMTAIAYSLLLPGLGQVYTENYWKVPIFTGTAIVTAWVFFSNNANFNTTSDLYDQAIASGANSNTTTRLLQQREAYRDNRDMAGVIFLLAYGLAAVDAYVGAHLYDFDVSNDVSLGIGPTRSHLMAMSLRLKF